MRQAVTNGKHCLSVFAVSCLVGAAGCVVHVSGAQNGVSVTDAGAFGDHRAAETVQKSFRAESVRTLRVNADSGDITIAPTAENREEIHIRATKTVTGPLSEAKLKSCLAKIAVTAALRDGALTVESHMRDGALPAGVGYSVDYEVTVPKRLALDLRSGSGDVTAHGVSGGMNIRTASGDVEAQPTGGALTITTASGGIKADGAQAADEVTLESASGDIDATGIRAVGSALHVHLTSQSGEITFAGDAGELALQTASGDIEAQTTAMLPLSSARVRSISGSVTLTLPPVVAAQTQARSVSGEISLPDTVGRTSEDESEDAPGQTVSPASGPASVIVETTSGDIDIKTER